MVMNHFSLIMKIISTLVILPILPVTVMATTVVETISYSHESLPGHTIYQPRNLVSQYPVVLWGNGSCVNSSYSYESFLREVAAQGLVVIAIGPYRDSPYPRRQRSEDPADWPPFETNYRQHFEALEWAEDVKRGGIDDLGSHLDLTRIAVMGHSCGGLQAVKASSDPRVTTTVVLNSGLFPDDDQYMIRHEAKREDLLKLHAPIAYFIGGETDIAYLNAEQDWLSLQYQDQIVINANMEVGHGATYDQPGGYPFAEGPIEWLKFQLLGNEESGSKFTGENCGFCSSSEWIIKKKGI